MSWSSYHSESRWSGHTRFLKRAWEFSWKAFLTLLVPLLIIIGWYVYQASKYDLAEVEKMPARTVLIDREGVEIGTVHGANRRLLEYKNIPDFLKTSLFAREDARFMDHEGVDFFGLARATLRNIKDLDFTQGASTLSMQLARNTYDLREKKSLNRKFLEIALTYRIEAKFSKEKILTSYLNRIYFGAGCKGIEEAALTYYGKPTQELSKGQIALLVGIIRAPHACSPWRNLEGATRQRDEVLARLVDTEVLTTAGAEEIKAAPLKLLDRDAERAETSHGARVLRRPLEIVLNDTQITTGGLRVITSIDFSLQQGLEKTIACMPLPTGCQMAALALDPRNGDILGVVGCREEKPTGFNRALDSHRDLGPEMIEPLIGTIALERGHLPIAGNPVSTGRQLQDQDARQLIQRFGFEGKLGLGEDLYRGSLSVSLLELATAYATLLQQGERPAPVFVRELLHDGKSLFRRPPAFYPAFSSQSTLSKIPSYLTGTSLPRTDLWAAVLSEDKVIVVWIGFDKPRRLDLGSDIPGILRRELEDLGRN